MNVAQLFERYYDGQKPFMTEHVYGYDSKKISNDHYLLFEKSEGTGIYGEPLYGCSVLLFHEEKRLICKIDLSQAFGSKEHVEDYIKSLDLATASDARIWEVKAIGHPTLKNLYKEMIK